MGTPEDTEFSATLDNTNVATQTVDSQVSEEQKQATVDWEKRFKDTQAAYTKSQQELVSAKAKLKVLSEQVKVDLNLSSEQKAELDNLKYENPDEWRAKVTKLEQEAKNAHEEKISQAEKELSQLELRKLAFDEFSANHPDIILNDEVINFDVPYRIKSKLEKGETTFEEFLQEAYDYLKTPKKIGTNTEVLGQPNLSKVGGGSLPSKDAIAGQSVADYSKEIY
jgi:Skp family chaperone for outer membrane proteins